eukprot:SAG22_NODE_27_length_29018_cov_465.809646_9_plen_76_part_00
MENADATPPVVAPSSSPPPDERMVQWCSSRFSLWIRRSARSFAIGPARWPRCPLPTHLAAAAAAAAVAWSQGCAR